MALKSKLKLEPPVACEGETVLARGKWSSKSFEIWVAGQKVKGTVTADGVEFTVPQTPMVKLIERDQYQGGIGGIFEASIKDGAREKKGNLIVLGWGVDFDPESKEPYEQEFLFLVHPALTEQKLEQYILDRIGLLKTYDEPVEDLVSIELLTLNWESKKNAKWLGDGKLIKVNIKAPRNTMGYNLWKLRKEFDIKTVDAPTWSPNKTPVKLAKINLENQIWAISPEVKRPLLNSAVSNGGPITGMELEESYLKRFNGIELIQQPVSEDTGQPTGEVWVAVLDSAKSNSDDPYEIKDPANKKSKVLVKGHGVPIANIIKSLAPSQKVSVLYKDVLYLKDDGKPDVSPIENYQYAVDSLVVKAIYEVLREARLKFGREKNLPIVINLSLGSSEYVGNSLLELALIDAVRHGAIVVVAAGHWLYMVPKEFDKAVGNHRHNSKLAKVEVEINALKYRKAYFKAYPAAFELPGLLSVGGLEQGTDGKWNGMPSTMEVNRIDIWSPGRKLWLEGPKGSEGWYHGSSFATAVVSGCLAQLWEQQPKWSVAQLVKALKQAHKHGHPKDKSRIPANYVVPPYTVKLAKAKSSLKRTK